MTSGRTDILQQLRQTNDTAPGDVFACWGTDWVSRGISLETSLTSWLTAPAGLKWSPSHVAIACTRYAPDHDLCYWFESTSMSRRLCLESGFPVHGVQVHRIDDRVADYVKPGGRVVQYRLTDVDTLDELEQANLRRVLFQWVGTEDKPAATYDTTGAAFSGLRLLPYSPFRRADLESLFCSEMVAAVLQRCCLMNRSNPARYNPGRLLRTLVRQGTYKQLREYGG